MYYCSVCDMLELSNCVTSVRCLSVIRHYTRRAAKVFIVFLICRADMSDAHQTDGIGMRLISDRLFEMR